MAKTLLNRVLSGLYGSANELYEKFYDYDDQLYNLTLNVEDLELEATGEVEIITTPENPVHNPNTILYSVAPTIKTLQGAGPHPLTDGKLYRIEISSDHVFTLPDVTNNEILHEIILTVKFNGVYYPTFKDSGRKRD